MIARISGRLAEKNGNTLLIDVHGIFYEVLVPGAIAERIDGAIDGQGNIQLVIYHYLQISPSSGMPILVGFLNEVEKDFFEQFIKVSGIGPRAAVKAINKPISEISRAISVGDEKYLKTLPGIGAQKAKEVIAKLQDKIGKYGLIQDDNAGPAETQRKEFPDWQQEALEVLLQLQYKKPEAVDMMEKALKRRADINSAQELLNEIYKQRIK
ncbi:MAG: hypothetical protein A2Z88_02930 [Omnitrophica WOR_2 bacterium GWA2_47_8]|nr:MAG: hypothetical protein A2Z88_02930 [Omnitrophica WOR_2 bacterium GWA2_47_8]